MHKKPIMIRIFLISWLVCALSMIFVFSASYLKGVWDPNNEIILTNMSICSGPEPITGKSIDSSSTIRLGEQPIYVCGEIKTSVPVKLTVNWYRNSNDRPFYINPIDEEFYSGYFFSKLRTSILETGDYYVEVWYGRTRLSTIYFTVIL